MTERVSERPLVQVINAERIVVLGWGRAILAQLAHPLVAAGVADHSRFATDWRSALCRFRATVDAMRALTFGPPARAIAVAERIARTHDRVHGILPEPLGPYPAGTRYSAHDPELLTWVHVTTIEATLVAYERFVAPLDVRARDQYCAEATAMERWLGAPPGTFPRSWAELEDTIARVQRSGAIVVTPLARRLAAAVLNPPQPWWLGPAARAWRWLTLGLLPAWLREAYALSWTERDQQRFDRWCRIFCTVWRALPTRVRHWPEARAGLPLPVPPDRIVRVGA
ncbi:oxygenase MpaB family protein [Thermomicrobium sp. 4228-Ro]|uniref:oxygenase MpaB family protein n=1 Tax=Thermomicrobium sp. 4228-Ro TaxID=2993937 RepID=UPI0022497AF4|nr:oxygenase MpaB family protein [Thermomicrobium sp. 4228-Ro]MCX2728321.1 oxygenase MpaB family protein [Thermomicrobium sp. 4228-Ro]